MTNMPALCLAVAARAVKAGDVFRGKGRVVELSLGQQLAPHLPFLRRYARALTGSQQHGDNYVRAALQAILDAPDEFPRDVDPRLGLYRTFQAIFNSTDLGADDEIAQSDYEHVGNARLKTLQSQARQALLLTAMEGFAPEDAAHLLDVSTEEVKSLVEDALSEIERQTRTSVLIIEDEPMIAMDLEAIVRELGHSVTGVAVTRDEAVASAAETRPGLVLADIQLADDSSGIDAVADILKNITVPVIFITAFPERLLTGERPEPTFLITKPFQHATVRAAISQALFFDKQTAPA
ncbi:Response regulator [Sphingomonas antarctica]